MPTKESETKKSHGLLTTAVILATLLAAVGLTACGGSDEESATSASPSAATSVSGDVVVALASDPEISQFAQAAAAGALEGAGPYTVFAPTNEAVSAAGVTLDADMVSVSVIEGEQLAADAFAAGAKYDSMLEATPS